MYLHLGHDTVIKQKDILGISDMDTATEQEIIRHFFRKDRQERLYWELSGKKRAEFYWHLAGTRELKPECLHDISGDQQPLKQIFRQTGAGSTVYFIGRLCKFRTRSHHARRVWR